MTKRLPLAALLLLASPLAFAQVKLTTDTLQCHIIHFSAGALAPGFGSNSGHTPLRNMRHLYSAPWLDFAIGCDYKYRSGWTVTLDADLAIGNDNLRQRQARLGDIYGPLGYPLASDGSIAGIEAYNRNLSLRIGIARLIPLLPRNPNSGLLLKASAGWIMQKTAFNQNYTENPVPLLADPYSQLYDNLRNGIILSQSIAFQYMSNYLTYVNLRVSLEISQCLTWSSRPYLIDNLTHLNGKDHNRYFDLLYGLKLTWMFPLTGKTTYDYYY